MSTPTQLDRTFQVIMTHFLDTGQAPHYTELASELNVPMEEGRKALHELYSPGFPGWLFPKTDYIGSFPPFSNLPTQYRISVYGRQKWFAQ
ncbi:MAG: hypothetical protein HY788_08505 [Deltaproteobacteria bacterium]|nr:hypothetical protein [Deltaproteobacteria bacterium]